MQHSFFICEKRRGYPVDPIFEPDCRQPLVHLGAADHLTGTTILAVALGFKCVFVSAIPVVLELDTLVQLAVIVVQLLLAGVGTGTRVCL